jgi:hypothetical protein
MKKLIVALCVLAFSCQEDEHACYMGTVLGYEECSPVSIIALKGLGVAGKPLTWDGKAYQHVIKVPGVYTKGTLYFSMRKYSEALDKHLLGEPQICPLVYGPYNVPMFTITASSDHQCP